MCACGDGRAGGIVYSEAGLAEVKQSRTYEVVE